MILRAVFATAVAVMTAVTVLFSQIALYDPTVMQGLAQAPDGSWVFAQVTAAGRAGLTWREHITRGDITLTRVTPGGTIRSHMFLTGFGHGATIAVQPSPSGGQAWIWTETAAVPEPAANGEGFGTKIARFRWAAGKTLTMSSPGVEVFGVNAGAHHQTVSLDLPHGLIGDRYVSPTDGHVRIAVYRLTDFLAHKYPALRRITVPDSVTAQVSQGWALLPGGTQVAYLTGAPYSAANPPPGNAKLTVFDATRVVSVTPLLEDATLEYREPEGVTVAGGRICHGFASGPAGARRASVYCR